MTLINLKSVSANKQLYGLGIATKIIQQNLYHRSNTAFSFVLTSRRHSEQVEEAVLLPNDICSEMINLLSISDIERIKVTTAILLCCLEQNTKEVCNYIVVSVIH